MKERYLERKIVEGLKPLKKDERDFSLAGVFGQVDIKEVTSGDFMVAQPLKIRDQGDTDFCSAYAVIEVSEDQEGELLLPTYQFFKTKQISGDPESWGADLRDACKAPIKFGSLPLAGYEEYADLPRSKVVDPATWPIEFDVVAAKRKKATYFKVDGKYDTFDNIRAAMWQHMDERRSIVVGACWRSSWVNVLGGVIPEEYEEGGFGHAFKICGQKVVNNTLYLVAQLSNSPYIGDNGLFYFSRDVVNKEFTPYGQFMFKDVERETVESTQKEGWYTRFMRLITNLFKK